MAKSATVRVSITADQKHLGKEPEFSNDKVVSNVELVRCYNWYNYFKDRDDSKKYIQDFCEANNIPYDLSFHTNMTMGWLARMVSRGAVLDFNVWNKLNSYVFSLNQSREQANDNVSRSTTNKLELWLPDIEKAVDNFNQPFDCYQFIVANNIPQLYVKQIADYYRPIAAEIELVKTKKDPQLNEGYKIFSRADIIAYQKMIQTIIDDCERYLGNVKKERKPKKKRTKSIDTVLKYFKYLKHDDQLKLSSEDPSKIIGSSTLYVLNRKNNVLTMFVAKDGETLAINRMSIINYDETKTISKRVGRKVEAVINSIVTANKKARMKILDTVKSEPTKTTDRINESCLLIRIDK